MGRPKYSKNKVFHYNPIEDCGDGTIKIFLSNAPEAFALIDAEDYPKLRPHRWYRRKNQRVFYASTATWNTDKFRNDIFSMHSMVRPDLKYIDHKDGNGLNNTKANLRPSDASQNVFNGRKRKGSSKYRGVSFSKVANKWVALIHKNRKKHHLGCFDSEDDAFQARLAAEKMFYPEFEFSNRH